MECQREEQWWAKMARVIIDHIPAMKEDVKDLRVGMNEVINKANEILRLMAIGINLVGFGDGTTSENVECSYVNVEFDTAGTELSATHNLGKTPISIVGRKLDRAGDVYFSKAATSTTIYLKSNTDSTSGTLIIV